MSKVLPGTAIEVGALTKGCSKQLFDNIFMTGGITLSQVCVMTGLEPYLVQNWVRRKFLSPPKGRLYSQSQFSRIAIINMLRESLQIEQICELISVTSVTLYDDSDDIIKDDLLYHKYVDMLCDGGLNLSRTAVEAAADRAAAEFDDGLPVSKKQISQILQVMAHAHFASVLRRWAQEIFVSVKP
jgi:DNA-binding transcriptional MerR regulator